jgi:competence protein ComEA
MRSLHMHSLRETTLASLLLCAPAFGQVQPGPLPEAPAKLLLEKTCASCHEIEAVIGSRRTRAGWQQTMDDMLARGAQGSDQDLAAIVEYLVTYFGKVNVNTASAAEVERLLGLSAGEAQAIAAYRQRNGKIKDFEELKKVPDVSVEKLQAKKALIAFSQ